MITARAPLYAHSASRDVAAVFDEWTPVHVATGAAAATLQIPPWVYLGLAVAYEAIELAHEYPSGSWIFGSKAHEWDVNVLTDLASGFLGYALVAWLRGDQANHP